MLSTKSGAYFELDVCSNKFKNRLHSGTCHLKTHSSLIAYAIANSLTTSLEYEHCKCNYSLICLSYCWNHLHVIMYIKYRLQLIAEHSKNTKVTFFSKRGSGIGLCLDNCYVLYVRDWIHNTINSCINTRSYSLSATNKFP